MRAAYDALDAAYEAGGGTPRLRPLVDLLARHARLRRTHAPRNGRFSARSSSAWFGRIRSPGAESLFLSSHAGTIEGWPVPEARAFLRDLVEHATQPRFVYVHRWQTFDLVMWDNRQTMHRVRRFDANTVRDMRRTTVAGTGPTVAQAQAA